MKKIITEINPFNNQESDNKIIYTIKILLKTFLIYFSSLLVAEAIVIAAHYPLGYDPMGNPMPMDILLLSTYYGYIITIIFFIIFTKKFSKLNLSKIGLDKNIKTFFKGIFLGLITITIIITILTITKQITFIKINKNTNYFMIILFMIGYLIQSTMEELICRGYLLHKLKNKISIYPTTLISILFFTIFHFSKLFNDGIILGLIGCTNLLIIGIIWTLLTLKDKNIYNAIGFHFIWNFTLFNIIGLNLSGLETNNSVLSFSTNTTFLTGSSYGIESSIITTIILFSIMIILIKKTKKNY